MHRRISRGAVSTTRSRRSRENSPGSSDSPPAQSRRRRSTARQRQIKRPGDAHWSRRRFPDSFANRCGRRRGRLQARLDKVSGRQKRNSWPRQQDHARGRSSPRPVPSATDHDPGPRYRKALTDYARRRLRGDPTGRGRQSGLLDEQPVWVGALRVGEADGGLGGAALLLDVDPKIAADRAKQCQRIVTDHPNSPDVKLARQYASYLEAVARREGLAPRGRPAVGGRPQGARGRLAGGVRRPDLWVITIAGPGRGQRYYYIEPPEESRDGPHAFAAIVDFVKAKQEAARRSPTRSLTETEVKTPQCCDRRRKISGRTWPGRASGSRKRLADDPPRPSRAQADLEGPV